jgi:hypothetical protein
VYMCAATLVSGQVFSGGRLEKWIKWLFILNGLLFIAPMIAVSVLPLPINETGTAIGDQAGRYANMVWSIYFASATASVAVLFRRLQKQFQTSDP